MVELILMTLLVLAPAQSSGQRDEARSRGRADLSQAKDVSFVELVEHPASYDGKIIRVEALWHVNFESVVLCPPGSDCQDQNAIIDPRFDCPTDEECGKLRATIDKNLEGDPFSGMRANFTIVGRFREVKRPMPDQPRLILEVLKVERVLPKASR